MVKKFITIPLLVAILIINGVLLTSGTATPAHPPIIIDSAIGNDRISPPGGIDASDGTSINHVTVSWSSVGGAIYYDVYRNTIVDSGTATLINSPASSPYNDASATPGEYYFYWVKACDSSECSSFSSTDRGYRALLPPASINATNGDYTDRVALTWSASTGASTYQVFRNTSNNPGGASQITSTASTAYDDGSAGPGILYYYWVKACATSGCSDFSTTNTGYRAITPPSSISASDGSFTDRVQINWSSTSGATTYTLYRHTSDSSGGASELASGIGSTSFNDTTATPGIFYYYWVKGCSTAGCSNFSANNTGFLAITPPTGVSATDGTEVTVVLVTWNASAGATNYEVWRNTTSNPSGAIQPTGTPNGLSFVDLYCTAGVQYYYWVKGCSTAGCSDFSSYDPGYKAITPPTSISATDGTYTNRVEITWEPKPGADYYQVWRNTSSSSGGASKLPSDPSSSPYNDTTATPGALYYYWIKGCGTAGCSDFSSYNTGYRAITAPTGLNASDGNYTDRVQVTWSSSTGATFYEVWRNTSSNSGGASKLPNDPGSSPYNDTTAVPGTQYFYWVKGCSITGCSDFSSSNSGYRAITAPNGVSATDGTHTDRVVISWNASSGATYYEIWRNTSATPGGSKLDEPLSSPFSDTTATPGIPYFYFIKGCVTISCSDFSSSDHGYRAIIPPTGVSASDGTYTNQVQISWSTATGATYYQVWRNTTNSTGGASNLGSPSSSPFNDTTAAAGLQYYYWVKGCSTAGCSDFSTSNPGYRSIIPPTSVSASDGTYNNRVEVTWSPSSGAIYYEIWRNTSSSSTGASKLPSDPSSSPYNDTTATIGVLYYYWVKGCSTTGCSDFSSYNTGYRAITPPVDVLATDGTLSDRVDIFWSASSGATYYEIWRNTTNSPGGSSKLGGAPTSSPYSDTTANPGVLYYYWVKGCTPAYCSDFSLSDSGYRAITPPASLTASDGTYTDRVLITWSPSSGASSYEVWRNTTNSPGSAGLLTTVGTNSLNDTTAIPGAQYYYWVKGCNTNGCSDLSSYDPGFRAITPPTGVSATDGTFTDRVAVSWNPSTGAAYYEIWRNTSSNPAGASQLPGSPSTSPYDDSTANPGVEYYYWVRACVSSTGCTDLGPNDEGYRAITSPTGVSASDGIYTDKVELTWSPSSGATYYEIWRNTSNVPGGSMLGDEPPSSPYNDTTGAPGQLYYYFIKGCTPITCSDWSTSDDGFRALTPPTSVSATDGTYIDKVVITWSTSSGATFYEVWRLASTRSGGGIEITAEKLGETASSPYNDTTSTPGTQYTYWVTACTEAGCSELSVEDTGYRAITAPLSVSASDGTYTDRVQISWNSSTGAAFYTIWRNTINDSASASDIGGTSTVSPYNDTTAIPGTQYFYWVKACSTPTICSCYSASDSGYREFTPPSSISASDGTYTDRVEISWSTIPGAAFYEIWRSTSNNPSTASDMDGSPIVSPYYDLTAVPGTQYYYWVTACSMAMTCSDFSVSDGGYAALTPPPSVGASEGTYTDKVVITWTAVSGATYYEVWRDYGTRAKELLPGNPTGSSYEDFSAVPGELYMYWVKACSDTGCSGFSESALGYRDIAMDHKIYLPLILN